MATTSPDNLWSEDTDTPGNRVTIGAAMQDSVQEALNNIHDDVDGRVANLGNATDRATRAGTLTVRGAEAGAVIAAGGTVQVISQVVSGAFPAGSVLTVWAEIFLAQAAAVTIAGNFYIHYGGSFTTGTEVARRRWHTHGYSGSSTWSVRNTFLLPADATDPVISVTLTSDSTSGGGIELWDAHLSATIDRTG